MFNTLKNTFLLSIITCVIAGLLLGLSFAANSASVTYYTFVMYQPQGGNWQLPKSSELTAGSYRFQIVRIPGDALLEWIALRGEFEFEADPAGGVKIKKQQALDEYAPIDNNSTLNYSLWETGEYAGEKNWKKAGRIWVQPLISQMDKTITGASDPNFMRFLIKKGINEQWKKKQNEIYHLYRLHYLDTDTINQKYKRVLSRFINPSLEPTAEVIQLKTWLEQHEGFTLAKYLGTPDEKHKAFYEGFKTWFNQLFPKTTLQTNGFSEQTTWKSRILTIIIISIIVIAIWFFSWKYNHHSKVRNIVAWFTKLYNRHSKKYKRHNNEEDENNFINEQKSQKLSKQTTEPNFEPKKTQATLKNNLPCQKVNLNHCSCKCEHSNSILKQKKILKNNFKARLSKKRFKQKSTLL